MAASSTQHWIALNRKTFPAIFSATHIYGNIHHVRTNSAVAHPRPAPPTAPEYRLTGIGQLGEHIGGFGHDAIDEFGAAGQIIDDTGHLAAGQRAEVGTAVDHAGAEHHRGV